MFKLPNTYEEWKHCITVSCDIPLTPRYIEERIATMNDLKEYTTMRFIERWGMERHKQTLLWFEQAAKELAN